MLSKVIELVGVVKFLSIADSKRPPNILELRVMPHPFDFSTNSVTGPVLRLHTHTHML
jgi:hypothetical protein